MISLDDLNASLDRSSSQMDLLTNAKLLRAFGFKYQQWIFEGQGPPTTSIPPDILPVDHEETSRTSYWSGFVSREDATIAW